MTATGAWGKSGSNEAKQRNHNKSTAQPGSGKWSITTECSSLSVREDSNNRRTNGGKDSSRRSNTGCGFGRGERCAPWKAANGKPRNARLWNLSDYVTPTAAGSGSPMPMARHRQNSAVSEEIIWNIDVQMFSLWHD
jgi:hypothetical protein